MARFGPSACPSSQPFHLPSIACTRAPRKPRPSRRPSCPSIKATPVATHLHSLIIIKVNTLSTTVAETVNITRRRNNIYAAYAVPSP